MAVPILFPSIAGAIVAGITQFLVSRAGAILAGLGLTFIGVKGFDAVIGYAVQDIQQAASAASGGGSHADAMVQMAAYAGLFDYINIVLSSYTALGVMLGTRFIMGRLK